MNLPIPISPLDKQKEIANHITGIRQQAQQLKDKPNEALKKANAEIEQTNSISIWGDAGMYGVKWTPFGVMQGCMA